LLWEFGCRFLPRLSARNSNHLRFESSEKKQEAMPALTSCEFIGEKLVIRVRLLAIIIMTLLAGGRAGSQELAEDATVVREDSAPEVLSFDVARVIKNKPTESAAWHEKNLPSFRLAADAIDSAGREQFSTSRASGMTAALAVTPAVVGKPSGFQWRPALEQSFAFLMFEHGARFLREPSTRKQLPGKFWKDYADSVLGLDGWRDGDPLYVNYVGHPMQGAVTGYIQIQNDPKGKSLEFNDPGYWKSRSKAMAWNAAYSVQFEIGPISEASLGNVGKAIDPRTGRTGAAAVDLVVTPTVGTAWLIGEDILDRYVVRRLESTTGNRFLKSLYRGILNPDRAMANMLAGKVPWHRDTRGPIWHPRVAVVPEAGPDSRAGSGTY